MDLGDCAEAFSLASDSTNARSDCGKSNLVGDGWLKAPGDACCADQVCGSGKDALVRNAGVEDSCQESGDGGETLAPRKTDSFNVGFAATASSMGMNRKTCAHSSFPSQADCKPYASIDSEASCEVGCKKATLNEAGTDAHCLFSSRIDCEDCEAPLETSLCRADGNERFCKRTEGYNEAGHVEDAHNSELGCSYEAGNSKFHGWVSPRISFSRDFVMADVDTALPGNAQNIASRLSPEKRKWDQQDEYSIDFEFLRYAPTHEGAADTGTGFMLSADELFSNGKLLPVPFSNCSAPCDDLYLPLTSEQHRQQPAKLSLYKSSATRPMARHLSFELSGSHCTTSHVAFSCTSSPSRVSEADNSSCAAPGLHSSSLSLMPTLSPSKVPSVVPSSLTTLSSPSCKYSAKLKELFKLKKALSDSSNAELSRENSFTSTSCMLPISPRSFWPFARGSSICDRKSSTTCRRILEMDVASLDSAPSQIVDGDRDEKSCTQPPKIEGCMASINEDASGSCEAASAGEALNAETSLESQAHSHSCLNGAVDALQGRSALMVASRARESSDASEALKKKTSPTSGFARGSPGRRGGTKKFNSSKIVLRNLERCSVEKRLSRDGWKGLSKRGSYCAATRVSPVLNVAIYRGGNASKNGFFSFSRLFSSGKNKKPMEATAIHWRKGA